MNAKIPINKLSYTTIFDHPGLKRKEDTAWPLKARSCPGSWGFPARHGGTPKWMVYKGKYDLGVPLFQETTIWCLIDP